MSPFKTLSEKLNVWLRNRDAIRQLNYLSERDLEDIGIPRGNIRLAVIEAAKA